MMIFILFCFSIPARPHNQVSYKPASQRGNAGITKPSSKPKSTRAVLESKLATLYKNMPSNPQTVQSMFKQRSSRAQIVKLEKELGDKRSNAQPIPVKAQKPSPAEAARQIEQRLDPKLTHYLRTLGKNYRAK